MSGPLKSKQESDGESAPYIIKLHDRGIETLTSSLKPFVDEKNGYVVLGRSGSAHKKWRRKGLLQIGAVNEHQEMGDDLFGREVFIDAAFPHIIFICGKRGSGKSYTLGIFAEELLRSSIGVGVILVDPIGIFWSLKIENSTRSEKRGLEKWGLSPTSFPEVKVLAPGDDINMLPSNCDGPYTIGISEMTAEDWCQVFDMERFKTQGLLIGTAIDLVRNGYNAIVDDVTVEIPSRPDHFSIGDIINCMERSTNIISKTGGFNPQTRRSLIARFRAAAGWGIFSVEGTPIRELTSPNRLTVLDVSDTKLGDAKRSLITGIIARKVLAGRIHTSRLEEHQGYNDDDPSHIPLTWLLIDEAHIILPHSRQTPATEALVEYAKQGRRPGCALVLATQRPSSTSDEILSQVDLLIGHNLALEDDMTALRRRVPAKLPQEFAVSDFIRAIPVGTALIADQKTQQRSFLLKLRPRLSHHAGSSAMPKAFQDKKTRKKKVPITATHIPKNQQSVLEPTPIQVDQSDIEEDEPTIDLQETVDIPYEEPLDQPMVIAETPLPDIPWGSTIMLKDRSIEDLEMFLSNVEGTKNLLIFSPTHISDLDIPNSFENVKDHWITSEGTKGSLNIQDLDSIIKKADKTLKGKMPWIIILDEVEKLFAANPSDKVKGLLASFHERAFSDKHLLMIRTAEAIDNSLMEDLMDQIDQIESEEEKPVKEPSIGDDLPFEGPLTNGSLSSEELKWMCSVMDLPTNGSERDLLDRLIDVEKEDFLEGPGQVNGRELLKHIMEESTHAKQENERLRNKIEDLEKEIGIDETVAKPRRSKKKKGPAKDKRLVLVWEDEEGQEENLRDLIDEVEDLRGEVDSDMMEETQPGSGMVDSPLNKILEMLEKERSENLDRLDRLEGVLQEEMGSIRGEMEQQRKRMAAPKRSVKLRVVKKKPNIPEWKPPILKKKRVLKRGEELTAISPKIGANSALEISKRNLKRSLLKGPKESIEELTPAYIPLYRFMIRYKGGLMKAIKESDIYIDALTGEIVEQGRNGLRRSRGFKELLKVTDLEMSVLSVMTRSPRDPTWISKYSKVDLSRTKRTLTSLEKKGMISKLRKEANLDQFSIVDDLLIPKKPWTKDHGFEPEYVTGIEEKVFDPVLSSNDATKLIKKLSGDIEMIEQDMVRYPVYIVKIRGEGRIRYIAVDGVGGRVDRELSSSVKEIISSNQ